MPERLLEVSDLPPPEPLERALQAVDSLVPGEYLRMLHRREPRLLFPELQRRGCAWHMQAGRESAFEIYIWRREDRPACEEAAGAASARRARD